MEKKINFSQIWKADASVRLLASGIIADGMLLLLTALAAVACLF